MRVLLLLCLLAVVNFASATNAYEMKGVVLLQPEFVIEKRTSAGLLAPYIRSVNAAAADVLATRKQGPASGFLTVAIRPGKQSAVWLDIHPALPPALAKTLLASLRAVPVPDVQVGPVVFAVRVGLWGGTPSENQMPAPEEWKRAASEAKKPLETEELVNRIWPR